jgi:tripartite-type tricarboxylate transporter receptor subunit TctC
VVSPAGLPGSVVDKLWSAVHAAMAEKSVNDNLASGGSEIVASKPEEFRQVIERDYVKYGKLSDLFKSAN